jgi:nucleoside phosphorylase
MSMTATPRQNSSSAARTKTAVIITALDVECRAVLRHLPGWTDVVVEGTVFYRGRFADLEVVVAEAGVGNAASAAIIERAIRHFRPRLALFVGVAGGIKDVSLGDVVIATKVYGYESGKEESKTFKPRAEVFRAAHEIEQRGRALGKGGQWRERLNPSVTHNEPNIYVAPIAAGEKLVATTEGNTATLLSVLYSDAVAVEMEGRGFLEGVHLNAEVRGGIVRGISDLLDGKTEADKAGSQQRAADAASAAAFEILAALDGGGVSQPAIEFREKPSTFSKAAYFESGEVLARIGVPNVDEISYAYGGRPDAYLRVIPTAPLSNLLSRAKVVALAEQGPPLLRATGYGGFAKINDHGALFFDPGPPSRGGLADLHLATELFQNGEVWCTSDLLIVRERGFRPNWIPLPIIPAYVLENTFHLTAHRAVRFALEQIGITPPVQIEFGLVGVRGVHFGVPTLDTWERIQEDEVILRRVLMAAEAGEIDAALLDFFSEVFDHTGQERPANLHNFPPGPLRPPNDFRAVG